MGNNFLPCFFSQSEEELARHETIANLLILGTIVVFVLMVMYAYYYENLRRPLRIYIATKLLGCMDYDDEEESQPLNDEDNQGDEEIAANGEVKMQESEE